MELVAKKLVISLIEAAKIGWVMSWVSIFDLGFFRQMGGDFGWLNSRELAFLMTGFAISFMYKSSKLDKWGKLVTIFEEQLYF